MTTTLVICNLRYKCEYGPQDYSKIVKPISEELLPKPKMKPCTPELQPEGNALAPTRKARAKRSNAGEGRKPPRKFKSKTASGGMDAMDWMVEDPTPLPTKGRPRKKKIVAPKKKKDSEGCVPMQTAGTCYGIPDLNEVPAVEDSVVEAPKVVKKRALARRPCRRMSSTARVFLLALLETRQ